MLRSKSLLVVLCLGTGALVAQACKKKDQETQYPPPGPTQTAPPPTATATAPPPPPPTATTPPPPPPPAQPDMVTLGTLTATIQANAKKDAKFMKPSGEVFSGMPQEGGVVEHTIMIDQGKCYGVVAAGGAGIVELDVQIMAKGPIPLPGPIIAVDSSTGPNASITPCWKNAFPVGFPAAVIVKATRGSGPVAAQVYVK